MEKYVSTSLCLNYFVDFIKPDKDRDLEYSPIVSFTMKVSLAAERKMDLGN